jgi:glycine/D-amino acid oxidase-like deaminating enzyme
LNPTSQHGSSFDAIVIGAGIVGAACALELAEAKLSVAVIERDVVGSGATAAGMGHIVAMDDSEAQFALTSYSQMLWKSLARELPSSVEYHRCGTIWVAADDEEMAEVRRKRDFYTARGIDTEVLDQKSLAEAEPNLAPMVGGLRVPSDAVIYPPAAAVYLIEKAVHLKAQLLLGAAVVSAAHGRVLLEDGTQLQAPIIINATGAVSPELTPGIAVRERKGHLVVTDRYPRFLHHQLVELGYLKSAHSSSADSVAFNVQPRKSGELVIGSSRQFDAAAGVDPGIVAAMIDRAALYMPGLRSLSTVRSWSGFRAATPDKLPLIGPTEDPSIYLATGHEGLGITTSLGTARLLAGHLLGRPTAIPIEPYLPSRSSDLKTNLKA